MYQEWKKQMHQVQNISHLKSINLLISFYLNLIILIRIESFISVGLSLYFFVFHFTDMDFMNLQSLIIIIIIQLSHLNLC